MNREIHVRFWESAGVRFPCATQPFLLNLAPLNPTQPSALSAKPDLDFNALLGQHVTVCLALSPGAGGGERYFDGLVQSVAARGATTPTSWSPGPGSGSSLIQGIPTSLPCVVQNQSLRLNMIQSD
jgi:hypothetical protein